MTVDFNGAAADTYTYDPYGRVTASTGTVPNVWQYTGAASDGNGLSKMGQRYYDSTVGRWTQQDPMQAPADPHQADRYVYAGGDPTNFTDLSGFGLFGAFSGFVSGYFGIAAVGATVTGFGAPVGIALGGISLAFAGLSLYCSRASGDVC